MTEKLTSNYIHNTIGAVVSTAAIATATYLGNKIGDGIGALIGGVASSIGLGVQYLRGGFPFISLKNREYWPLLWINESKGPVLEGPGTRFFVWPLVKRARKDKKPVALSARIEEQDSDFKFRTKDGLEGTLEIQYLYQIGTKQNALEFYWDLDGEISKVDEIVQGELTQEIGGKDGKEITSGAYLADVIDRLNNPANGRGLGPYGIGVRNLRIKNVDFDKRSQEILSIEPKAREEALATQRNAQATQLSMQNYLQTARTMNPRGTEEEIGNLALHLYRLDNTQQIAASGKATIINVDSPIPVRAAP